MRYVCVKLREALYIPRVDADDGCLAGGNTAGLVSSLVCVCVCVFPPPSNLASCQVRFAVMRSGSGLHTCASQPPATRPLDDITQEGQASPSSCLVALQQQDMNRLFSLRGFA